MLISKFYELLQNDDVLKTKWKQGIAELPKNEGMNQTNDDMKFLFH